MIRKLFAFVLSMILLFSAALAQDHDDIDITELLESVSESSTEKLSLDDDGAILMTITCTGDFTIGGDTYHKNDIFSKELEEHGGDIDFVMENVRDILMADQLTLVNFEGTLTDTTYVPDSKKNNEFLFSISPSYVSVLKNNGVEAVSLENNHVMDHGEEGYEDTKNALRSAGVIYSNSEETGIFEYQGIQVAMLSYLCIDRYGKPFGGYPTFEEKVCADIAEAKQYYPLVIVSFHWGNEKWYRPTDNQIRLGRLAVDSGADLVIGHHSHRIQPIEFYNGVFICYSLGNFCFAGHKNPSDKTSIMFQIRYRIKDHKVSYKDFRIIPIRISSRKDRNDFIPTPFSPGAETDSILSVLRSRDNTKNLPYAVKDFPLSFD